MEDIDFRDADETATEAKSLYYFSISGRTDPNAPIYFWLGNRELGQSSSEACVAHN